MLTVTRLACRWGDIETCTDETPPTLIVRALRDPDGANLDRIQIVKGWHDADGSTGEFVYDMAWSDNRVPDSDGNLPLVGNTVIQPLRREPTT